MGENFLRMSMGPPPFGESEFSKAWTIFMWAWFLGLVHLLVSLLQESQGSNNQNNDTGISRVRDNGNLPIFHDHGKQCDLS